MPSARIHINTPFFTGTVEGMCMKNPVCPLVLRNIQGARLPNDPDPDWKLPSTEGSQQPASTQSASAVTRGQAAKQGKPVASLQTKSSIDGLTVDQFVEKQKWSKVFHMD